MPWQHGLQVSLQIGFTLCTPPHGRLPLGAYKLCDTTLGKNSRYLRRQDLHMPADRQPCYCCFILRLSMGIGLVVEHQFRDRYNMQLRTPQDIYLW